MRLIPLNIPRCTLFFYRVDRRSTYCPSGNTGLPSSRLDDIAAEIEQAPGLQWVVVAVAIRHAKNGLFIALVEVRHVLLEQR